MVNEEYVLKQRKSAYRDYSSDPDYKSQAADTAPLEILYKEENDESGSGLSFFDIIRIVTGILMFSCFLSYIFTGSFTFGYNGKLINGRFIKHALIGHDDLVFTEQELSLYNGADLEKPIYLAINGTVYDVTDGKRNYGLMGAYNTFAGKDVARALATNCFNHLNHDIRDIEPNELRRLNGWIEFFDSKYWRIGTVLHEEPRGIPMSRKDCQGKFSH